MKKSEKTPERIIAAIRGAFRSNKRAFCNIAEGTHAGSMTMTAEESVDSANLIVKAGSNPGEIKIANATDKPIGVCNDLGSKGDVLNVAIPGSAESTFICVCSSGASYGDTLYTDANGKVTAVAAQGAYKVGVALGMCAAGDVVEVDPQGFGNKAWQIYDCGVFTWGTESATDSMPHSNVTTQDIVFATVVNSMASETSVSATPSNGLITFLLNANGTVSNTLIAWMIIRKN